MQRQLFIALSTLAAVACSGHLDRSLQGAEVRYYSFDSNFNDFSGNAQHGVAFDGNSNASTAGATITSNPGEYVFGGGAANFTAERDWVDIPNLTINSGNPYTLSFWARDTTGSTGAPGGMVIGQPDTTAFFVWLNSPNTDLRWRSSDNSAARQADFDFADNDDA